MSNERHHEILKEMVEWEGLMQRNKTPGRADHFNPFAWVRSRMTINHRNCP